MGINTKLRWSMLGIFLITEVAVFIPADNRKLEEERTVTAESTAHSPRHLLPAIIQAQGRTDEVIRKINELSEGENQPFWKSSLMLNYIRNEQSLTSYLEAQESYMAALPSIDADAEGEDTAEGEYTAESNPEAIEATPAAPETTENELTLPEIVARVQANRQRDATLRRELTEIAKLQLEEVEIIKTIIFSQDDDFDPDLIEDEWFALLQSREIISNRVAQVYEDYPELTLTNPPTLPSLREKAEAEPFPTPPPGLSDE